MSKQNINEHSKIEKKMGELTQQYGSNYELTHFFPYSSSTIVNNKASRIISPLESSSTPAVDLKPLDSNLHTFQSCSIGAAMKLADIKRLEEQKKVTKTKGGVSIPLINTFVNVKNALLIMYFDGLF